MVFVPFPLCPRLTYGRMTIPAWKKPMTDDETALIAAAQRNPADFAALYDRFVQPVYRYLYSLAGNADDAQDLTAQTFLAALETLSRYRHRGHFIAWLFRIAHSKAMDYFRHKPQVALDTAGHQVENADPLADIVYREEIGRLAALIRSLDDSQQELIRLRYVAELSFAEMAALLGRREDAVKKSLYRLLARLKSQME